MPKWTPAVAYYRCSTAQQEESIPAQRDTVERYARENGYRILREYVDEGISGDDTTKRAAFLRMIGDAKEQRDFDTILCWDQDRFGRFDTIDMGEWVAPLRRAGVGLVTVSDGLIDWNSFAGRIVNNVKQEAKHAYLRDLSKNVGRNMIHLVTTLKGRAGGRPPYGYRLVKTKHEGKTVTVLEPDDDEAPIVRELFNRYATGTVSLKQLVNDLNRRGVKTRNGRVWAVITIKQILVNPVYCGDTVYGRRSLSKYHTLAGGRPEPVNRPKKLYPEKDSSKWIVAQNTHTKLVKRDLFAAVQAMLAERRNKVHCTPHVGGGGFLLSGLLRCGVCGHTLIGRAHPTKSGDRVNGYVCGGFLNKGAKACRFCHVPEVPLVRFIASQLLGSLNDPERPKVRAAWERKLTEALRREHEAPPVDVKGIKAKANALERDIQQATKNLLRAKNAAAVERAEQMVAEWEAEKAALEATLVGAERTNRLRSTITQRVKAALDDLEARASSYFKADDEAMGLDVSDVPDAGGLNRETIRTMVEKIVLTFEDVPWVYKSGPQKGEKRRDEKGKSVVKRRCRGGVIHFRGDVLGGRVIFPEFYSTHGRSAAQSS